MVGVGLEFQRGIERIIVLIPADFVLTLKVCVHKAISVLN